MFFRPPPEPAAEGEGEEKEEKGGKKGKKGKKGGKKGKKGGKKGKKGKGKKKGDDDEGESKDIEIPVSANVILLKKT